MPSTLVRTVQIRGFTVTVRTTSSTAARHGADRPPYVLVHGLGMTHRYLDPLAAELAADAVVHSIDLPGYGWDPQPRTQLMVEDHGALIVAALAALGIRRAVLVGHSMGAQFVTAAALAAPELAERVVLLGPVVDRLRRTVLQQSVSLLHDTFRESPGSNAVVYTDYLRTGLRWYVRQLRPMMEYPLERAVEGVTCPVLVMRGGRDPVARRRWCRELADRATDGSFVEITGQAHVVQMLAAAHVAAEIAAFGRRPPRADAQNLFQSSARAPGKLEHTSA